MREMESELIISFKITLNIPPSSSLNKGFGISCQCAMSQVLKVWVAFFFLTILMSVESGALFGSEAFLFSPACAISLATLRC